VGLEEYSIIAIMSTKSVREMIAIPKIPIFWMDLRMVSPALPMRARNEPKVEYGLLQ
jgi:hypothetical protein